MLREGKGALDDLIDCSLDGSTEAQAFDWVIRICGLHGQIAVVRLVQDSLYASIPVAKFSFPSSITGLPALIDTFTSLMTFVVKFLVN